ncbi:MAG: hypothetical protein LC624_04995, partial [Halobacteriales archaeon]|nr:hypothetical protein [Halobacteriales archaeon]
MRAFAFACALLLLAGCTIPGTGDRTGPGDRAKDYLKAAPYTSILVELDYVNGAAPEDAAVSLLQQRMGEATGKTVAVSKSGCVPGQGAGHRYSMDEVVGLEGAQRQHQTGGSQAVLYML